MAVTDRNDRRLKIIDTENGIVQLNRVVVHSICGELMSSAAVTASSRPAAMSAGMPMKKDRRVAVTRSKRRNSPAKMVTPKREMPGSTGARAWKEPMMRASFHS